MKATLDFTIEQDNGADFSAGGNTWGNLTKEQANWLEGQLIAFLAQLNQAGAKFAAENAKSGK